jgi:lipoteichoic acid synthase
MGLEMKSNKHNLFTIVLLLFLLIRVLITFEVGASIFSLGILYDTIIFATCIYLLLLIPVSLSSSRLMILAFSFIYLSISIYQIMHYNNYEILFYRNAAMSNYVLDSEITQFKFSPTPFTFISIMLFLAVSRISFSIKKKTPTLKYFSYLLVLILIPLTNLLLITSETHEKKCDYYKSNKFTYDSKYDHQKYLNTFGYSTFLISDLKKGESKSNTEADFEEVYLHFTKHSKKKKNIMTGKYKGYNLITILAKSLDTRFVNPELTPNLYKLMNQSGTFSNYYTPVFKKNATCNSEFMFLTGLTAPQRSDFDINIYNSFPKNSYPFAMAWQLKANGYKTYYFNPFTRHHRTRKKVIPRFGFSTAKFKQDHHKKVTSIRDSTIIHLINKYVDFSSPFHVNILNHSLGGAYKWEYPYHVEKVDKHFAGQNLSKQIIIYYRRLVEFDLLIGKILEKLKDKNILDKTLIAILPDQRIAKLNKSIYYKYLDLPLDRDEARFKEEEIHHQKLILYDGSNEKITYNETGSTVDLAPTLLNALGVDANYQYFFGQDIFDEKVNYIMFPNKSITDGGNWINSRGVYSGNPRYKFRLEKALKNKLKEQDIQNKIIRSDFFKTLIEEEKIEKK